MFRFCCRCIWPTIVKPLPDQDSELINFCGDCKLEIVSIPLKKYRVGHCDCINPNTNSFHFCETCLKCVYQSSGLCHIDSHIELHRALFIETQYCKMINELK
jgi:hypothetical protein